MSTNEEKDKTKSAKETDKATDITTNVKSADLTTSGTGLTQQLGKPVVDKDDVARRNEEIRAEYQKLKVKKFAQSAISSSIGDLLGGTSKAAEDDEPEKGS